MANKEGAKKIEGKTVVIVILSAICMILLSLVIFFAFGTKTVSGSSKFLESTLNLQNKVSNYIGTTSSDLFGVYTNEEIIVGKTSKNQEEIKDNEDNPISPLVDSESKLEENNKVAYKINKDNVTKLLNTSMPDYTGIEFYIQDGEKVKVKVTTKPEWWNEDLDFLLVGKD